ncbi:phosphoadenylyl-sulfate reductase [Ectothiorhodospira variabilis]|uniref:phosphoadenylyl-sulfate reductase n=1 Tax=Ectothiorhodospira variabilis TaxID=505694 RepID=UPI001EFAD55C|nr:phosphoadenylyl-sulfate reductase [Ectothiorhodospira variabilis]MCG5494009.1 phosphoadenylyl-sulfate reductase [Ectothiorhodospira variabilis]MCG5503461.1 phosphoadenylyl-sulfate reductase [Ectothiorhodospira variabilis]MCG5506451.1 phosphoadenylyl-sulfate reductase [Ectothiorhodospira variabilis]
MHAPHRISGDRDTLERINRELEPLDARARVDWALSCFGDRIVLSSSFGAQAAVMLHLVTQARPGIPVILVDTGYLFPETYRFVDELTEQLDLNLQVYRSPWSSAWQEARFGRLWEQGLEGLNHYNRMNKVEPMQRALQDLGADAWLAGLRRQQSESRAGLEVVAWQNGRAKIHPIIDWTDRDVHQYLTRHGLPYHPLWHQGYLSIGDVHSTRSVYETEQPEQMRFFGLKRECGLHEHV